jgi:hypothetical protein
MIAAQAAPDELRPPVLRFSDRLFFDCFVWQWMKAVPDQTGAGPVSGSRGSCAEDATLLHAYGRFNSAAGAKTTDSAWPCLCGGAKLTKNGDHESAYD